MSTLQQIDEQKLESDLAYRFQYLTEFMGFTAEDVDIILSAQPLLAAHVDALVDAVYVKLFSYDCTKRHFVKRQSGYEGEVPDSMDDLTLDHQQIAFRKAHLATYLKKLVSGPYDAKMVSYLDRVGAMHTPKVGSAALDVPLVQMNALMGFVADAINATILGSDLPAETQAKAIRAFSKLLWLQNDLISRHYTD